MMRCERCRIEALTANYRIVRLHICIATGMHLWFNLKAGNAIGWLIDCCLRRKSIFPDGFFDSDGPEALRQQKDQGRPPDKRKDVVDMGSVKNTPNPKTAGTRVCVYLRPCLALPCLICGYHLVSNRSIFHHHF